jgi:glycosyltransferase involved in cell wall biosynthesis
MSAKVLQDLQAFISRQPAILVQHPLYDNFGALADKQEARKKIGVAPEVKLLLFFGFIRKYKGLDILLGALKQLQDPSVQLLVAGEFYEDRKYYEQLIREYGLEQQVILHHEFIPNEAVRFYFSAADVVIQPYRNATQSGVTPLAYHFNKPMIVTNVGGLPDYVPDGKAGLVTEPSPEPMAAAIRKFFTLGPAHFTEGISEEKQKFSWTTFSRSLLNLYQRLADQNPYAK